MSVIKSRRNESPVEFISTAEELESYTIDRAVSFPKRYDRFINQRLANMASEIHELVETGNGINPTCKHEAQMRRDCFMKALALIRPLVAKIKLADAKFRVGGERMRHWMSIVYKEKQLIQGILKRDKERYKNLP